MYCQRLFASIGIALLAFAVGAEADLVRPPQMSYTLMTADIVARQSRAYTTLALDPRDETEKTAQSESPEAASPAGVPIELPIARKDRTALLLAGGLLTSFALDRTVDSAVGEDGDAANAQETLYRGVLATVGLGYLFGKSGSKRTYGTACEAVIESGLMTSGLKYLTGRRRPEDANGDPYAFDGPGSGNGSFVSGHTSSVFAIATVLSNERPKRKWLYYGLAALVGASRIQKRAHFLSDVCGGAVLGVYAGRRAVRHETLVGKMNPFGH
ncbi:MAG: phosphatase PAP2 family protein [Armatimonadota bacterium]|nr:phosphatase PAP2 family protein [Armatimonadota bacterium]